MNDWPIMGSLAGKILRVNLTNRIVRTEETLPYASRWLGGRGVNSHLLLSETTIGTQWHDPEAPLIFGAGLLVGTTPGASRMSIDSINVFTGGKGSANVGGHFAAELKYAGFDHVVITGKSETPVYLWVSDGRAELRDARHLWGCDTYRTETAIRKELGDRHVRVACIGPAGERLVRGALILVDCSKAAGGSGVGCVMGSKKLKAIAVRGRGAVRPARPAVFFEEMQRTLSKVYASPTASLMSREGLAALHYADPHSRSWDFMCVVRNAQDDYWEPEKRRKLMNPKSGIPSYRKKVLGCFGCPIGCMPYFEIPEGPYAGVSGEGFWVNTLMCASMLDMDQPDAVLTAWLTMNRLGLDADFTAGMCAWAFECYERGLLRSSDTDGLDLRWGNAQAWLRLIDKIASREGLGDLLAQGPAKATREVGSQSEYLAYHIKGQPSIEPLRAPKGWALAVATSPVAGRHLRGATLGGDRFGPKEAEFKPDVYEEQARYVYWQGLTKEIEDAMGLCVYLGTWAGAYALEVSDYTSLINAAAGLDLDSDELMKFGKQSRNLEKAFNGVHTQLDRTDDFPPLRVMKEPIQNGPFKGYRCDEDKFNLMLDEFYGFQGWDIRTGLQTRKGLEELGMAEEAALIARAGRLAE